VKGKENFITMKVGRVTLCQEQSQFPECSIASKRAWKRYINHLKCKGKQCDEWFRYEEATEKEREEMLSIQPNYGHSYECFGPFPAEIKLQGVDMIISVYITKQEDFGDTFNIGREVFTPQPFSIKTVDNYSDMGDDSRARTSFAGRTTKALVDTGAGPSCMSNKFFRQIPGIETELQHPNINITAANNTKMQVHGLTDVIHFQFGWHTLGVKFIIVEDLGTDDVILGRDFIRMYDVMLDLPRGKIQVRNPGLKYRIAEKHKMDKGEGSYVGRINADVDLLAESITQCKFTVNKKHPNRGRYTGEHRWLAYLEEKDCSKQEAQGVRPSRSLAIVNQNQVSVMLLNANIPEGEDLRTVHVAKNDSFVNIVPVQVKYVKVPLELEELGLMAMKTIGFKRSRFSVISFNSK
jgi:hypothetical protein